MRILYKYNMNNLTMNLRETKNKTKKETASHVKTN